MIILSLSPALLFSMNAVLLALLMYVVYEGFHLSRPGFDVENDFRPQWVEKVLVVVSAVLNLILTIIAIGLAYHYYDTA